MKLTASYISMIGETGGHITIAMSKIKREIARGRPDSKHDKEKRQPETNKVTLLMRLPVTLAK